MHDTVQSDDIRQAVEEYQEPSEVRRILGLIGRQIALQGALILIGLTVVFPVVWIIAISLDSRNLPQYTELLLIPKEVSFRAFEKLIFEPFDILSSPAQEVYFTHLLSNSLFVSLGTAMLSVGLGASAAYAFSRFRFIGRQAGMLGFIVLLMMPATGTLVPLIAIFSLLKVHVFFSSFAPAVFFGFITALAVFGINAGMRNFLGRDWVSENRGRWIAAGLLIVFVFGLVFLGWMLLFRESDTYSESIRDPLRETNSLRDDLQDIIVSIPRRERNVDRQERFLDDIERELENVTAYFDKVSEEFPNAYVLVDDMRWITNQMSMEATHQEPSLARLAIPLDSAPELRRVALRSEVLDQEDKVAAAVQEVADLKAEQEVVETALDEARSPIYELRNDVIVRLLPYILATTLVAIVIAGLIWFAFNQLVETDVKLVRDVWFGRVTVTGYLIIIALITYAWFDVNYQSPTKQVGLEDGGLWYDIKLNFRDEDEIRDDLEPYNERIRLEEAVELLDNEGLEAYRQTLENEFDVIQSTLTQLQAIDTELDPPDNLSRSEEIEWKDEERNRIGGEIDALVSVVRPYLGRLPQLALLNNENKKNEFMEILQDRIAEIENAQEIVVDSESTEAAIASFEQEIATYPSDAEEEDRLRKELLIRSSNELNVSQQLKTTLFGLMIAYCSGALPFAIWNLKGYFDTIPKDLEEAALVDGANLVTSFIRVILPLSLPALAITTLFSFMTGWTEFILAWQFISAEERHTLAMALRGISGGGETQAQPDYTEFAAMSILMAIPVVTMFYIFQRWIVSGLTVGGVKG